MNCPVCKRDNAFTLSICPSCGTMMNDSVREDLITKVTPLFKPIPKPEHIELRGYSAVQNTPLTNVEPNVSEHKIKTKLKFELTDHPTFHSEIRRENPETSDLETKHTNPTLVEFHNKNAKLPEWRLQLKNAVRNRNSGADLTIDLPKSQPAIEMADSPRMRRKNLATSGANALKTESIAEPIAESENVSNPKLAAALKRIERSRKKFLEPEELTFGAPANTNNSLLYFTAKPNDHLSPNIPAMTATNQDNMISFRAADVKLDTNKLPELPKPAVLSSSFGTAPAFDQEATGETEDSEIANVGLIEIAETEVEIAEIEELELQEIDDCASIAQRFNSGLFDLIIGSFVGIALLIPFMSIGGIFTLTGALGFAAITALVMFIYLTTAIALYGRTFGMKLFSLEVIDIEGEEYPTIHQAAVSSAIYLISLAFAGIGFLTIFLNDENRAAHDLVSCTIVVKEF